MKVALQVADGMVSEREKGLKWRLRKGTISSLQCFLANHGFVHYDLSTRTVLVGPHLHVKIGNTGMNHEGYYYVVSERQHFLHDMAPECLWEKKFSLFSDV